CFVAHAYPSAIAVSLINPQSTALRCGIVARLSIRRIPEPVNLGAVGQFASRPAACLTPLTLRPVEPAPLVQIQNAGAAPAHQVFEIFGRTCRTSPLPRVRIGHHRLDSLVRARLIRADKPGRSAFNPPADIPAGHGLAAAGNIRDDAVSKWQ